MSAARQGRRCEWFGAEHSSSRRQITKEVLNPDATTFRLDWTCSLIGHLSGLLYPDETRVDFAPDALGRPSKAGSYARAVTHS
ncbi:MAG: hypothetical protein IT467_01605 [Dokdonella sp.]|uniref:hypothetical protein n=1 Tax=Dokdonella sp. TaxID=2291710 RepID=UPI0025BB538A|nr:hypothetical protein [Dokdonella sp.]MBZ0224000.1 hypothetical protein [Dokdonella sp.]MCC7254603.1 hypothetical protein [Dokdonella sp.]